MKPYRSTYNAPIWLTSFFDHSLPVYEQESFAIIPAALRDSNRSRLVTFLDDIATGPNADVKQLGVDSYSGHDGIDYTVSYGADVIAPASGTIRVGSEARIGKAPNDRANTCLIWIDHDASRPLNKSYDFSTIYMHMSAIGEASAEARNMPGRDPNITTWIAGDVIRTGEIIGKAGNDACGGRSDAAHLHFGVATGATNRSSPRIFDPYGWWSSTADPWTNAQLETASGLWRRPSPSLWTWAAPRLPAAGEAGYLGADILAQTDDTDASFQIFGPKQRRGGVWTAVLPNGATGIAPVGGGAWYSQSITEETTTLKKNWAIWALHVPASGQYRIQSHLPALPTGVQATTSARYTVLVPQDQGVMRWTSQAIDQRARNEWRDITNEQGSAVVTLRANTVVLVALTDITGTAGEAVVFDAIRLKAETPVQPPLPAATGRVGFAIDNSSSMVAQGKLSAVKTALPAWIDQLTASGARFSYGLLPFADNTPPVQATADPNRTKQIIAGLSGNDNGVSNPDCPEESLGAITQLASAVQGGTLLLFTDDLPRSPIPRTFAASSALAASNVKFHAIVLPKTCNFGPGNDPTGWLAYQYLSFATGGTYQSVTTANTTAALQIVLSEMRSEGQLAASGSQPLLPASAAQAAISLAAASYPLVVDSTVTKLNVLLNIQTGTATLTLRRPDGSLVLTTDSGVTFIDSGSAQYYSITNPTAGTWTATVDATAEYRFSSSVETSIQFAYLGETRGSLGQPLELAARLSGPVASAQFVVERADGQAGTPVTLKDDGTGNDLQAGDGLYTGYLVPSSIGDLRLRVSGTTTAGESFSRTDSRLIRILGLRVTAPAAVMLPPGTQHTIGFTVTNLEQTAQTYTLSAQSSNGWIQQAPPARITLAAGTSASVSVVVRIPNDAPGNVSDSVWLSATKASDGSVFAEDMAEIILPDMEGRGGVEYPVFLPKIGR